MAYLIKKIFFRTDGQTNRQMDERTDGRSDFITPQILFGGIKTIFSFREDHNFDII